MDQSKALNRLIEAADLVGMIEDLTDPGRIESLSAASLSGLRITLRGVRDTILSSHGALASDLVSRAKSSTMSQISENRQRSTQLSQRVAKESMPTPQKSESSAAPQITRKDLRAALEKAVK